MYDGIPDTKLNLCKGIKWKMKDILAEKLSACCKESASLTSVRLKEYLKSFLWRAQNTLLYSMCF